MVGAAVSGLLVADVGAHRRVDPLLEDHYVAGAGRSRVDQQVAEAEIVRADRADRPPRRRPAAVSTSRSALRVLFAAAPSRRARRRQPDQGADDHGSGAVAGPAARAEPLDADPYLCSIRPGSDLADPSVATKTALRTLARRHEALSAEISEADMG